jgi:acyl carrier protein phosphodiesterase
MHHFVDKFTDTHFLVKTSRNKIESHFRLLSGVFVDVFYDHFLARDFQLQQAIEELEKAKAKVTQLFFLAFFQ